MNRRWGSPMVLLFILMVVQVIGTACRSELAAPPRLATAEALAANSGQATAEPIILPAPTATGVHGEEQGSDSLAAPLLNVWINETSADHKQALDAMAADFSERSGIEVAYQFVDPALLPELAHTAVLSDTLPDLILHPLEFTVAWSEQGILDPAAADVVVDALGRETFDAGALELVDVTGQTAAIPSDGFQQLLLYRSDWFDDRNLDTPEHYDAMLEGAETLYDVDKLISGLVIPTESNLINTQRAFEHVALANGCQLIGDSGEVLLLEPECQDAIDFYYSIVNQFSPPGVQTDTSARNAFLDGRTAMIMSTPSILPDLVRANRLDQKTGIVTKLSGEESGGEAANLANITYFGITPVADREAASAFVDYWFNEGYQTWLAIESERKVPMRLGTADLPRFYIDAWGTSPVLQGESLRDIFGEEVVEQLRDDIGSTGRWGFRQKYGALAGRVYENLTFSIVLQEMLSGYFNSAKTLFEAYNRVIELIPDYQFPIVPTPEA